MQSKPFNLSNRYDESANPEVLTKKAKKKVTFALEETKSEAPFQEKHMIENLSVEPVDPDRMVIFSAMLNQGQKRGR